MPHCPIDGCDYRNDNPNSILGHVSSKNDKPHSGIGFQQAKALLKKEQDVTDEDFEAAKRASSENSDSESSSTSNQNPAFEGPEPDQPMTQSSDGESYGGPYPCPNCGGEPVDYREQEKPRCDFICSECEAGYWTGETEKRSA